MLYTGIDYHKKYSVVSTAKSNPLAAIWVRPIDYREAIEGTRFEPQKRPQRAYQRQAARELLIESKAKKQAILGGFS